MFNTLVFFNQRVGRMIVDRFKVLGFDHVRRDAIVEVEHRGDVAHHVLDEFRIVVGALGDVLLVRALQQPIELAGTAVGSSRMSRSAPL